MKNLNQIIRAALLVGTFDILAACLQFFINTEKEPSMVFKFIASGVFGSEAFSGGIFMIVAGLLFHYLIALAFTFIFFALYPKMHTLIQNNILIGILYGAFVWLVMKFIVIPLSHTPPQPFTYKGSAIAMTIIIVSIGIPLSVIAARKTWVRK